MSIADLKALYDFSVIHCEVIQNTENSIGTKKMAIKYRDRLFEELKMRMINEYVKITK